EDESATKEETQCSKTSASEPKEALATEQPKPNLPTPGQLPQHKCYFCGTVFENSLQFTNHLPSHFSEVPYACSECDGLVFKTVREASRHIGFHDARERPFKCRICPLRFPKRTNTNSSISREQSATPKREQPECEICTKKFTAKKNLTRHLMIHTGEKPFKCEPCGLSYRQSGELKRHSLLHGEEKPTDNSGSSLERVPDERPKRANKRRVSGKWLLSC
ncbi:AGAP003920-PA, partial [Anopheles gambiae str. PEST]